MIRRPFTHSLKTAQRGFTLIELLVVISVSVILGIAAAGLFFTTLIGNTKKEVLTRVKDEGDYAINQMEFLLRNAIALVPDPEFPLSPVCEQAMQRISFRSIDEGITTLYTYEDNNVKKIASKSAKAVNPVFLSSDSVSLSGLTFHCEQSSTNFGSYVTITFAMQKDSPDTNRPTPVREDFTTSVNIRSF
jgi:prepilin-type N-terminal cleavage/methylation domain-containing protein